MDIMRVESVYGNGRHRTVFTMLNIAVFAPTPRASAISATAEKPGCRRSMRSAKEISFLIGSNIDSLLRTSSRIGGSGLPRIFNSQAKRSDNRAAVHPSHRLAHKRP